jgi:hypothetical protein
MTRKRERKKLLHAGCTGRYWLFRHTPHELIDAICPAPQGLGSREYFLFLKINKYAVRSQCCMSPFHLLSSLNDFHRTLYERYVPGRCRNAVGVFVKRLLKFVRLYACDIDSCWIGLS